MKIPKRLETHLAAGPSGGDMQLDVLRVSDDGKHIEATDGIIVARVPLGGDSVRAEAGEELVPGAVLEPRAWAEAARGSTGEGTLRLQFGAQAACSAEGKPSLLFPPPAQRGEAERPPIDSCLRLAQEDLAAGPSVDLIVDAEALYRLSRALGAREGLRLRIPVQRGQAPAFGLVVEPAEGGGASGVLMPISREGQ